MRKVDLHNAGDIHKEGENNFKFNWATGLTCLQFGLAVYATLLLYFLIPSLDLSSGSTGLCWASRIALQWQDLSVTASSDRKARDLPMAAMMSTKKILCDYQRIGSNRQKINETSAVTLKQDLYTEILHFQQRTRGCETLSELMSLPSGSSKDTKITVILSHIHPTTLCSQIEALLQQTLPLYRLWIHSSGSSDESSKIREIVKAYNDSRMHFLGSMVDLSGYGGFQMALQGAEGADYVYFLGDDVVLGRRVLEIMAHAAGTEKYHNAVLGNSGRVLPFRQRDFSFPSYNKRGSREAGLYLPDPAYDLVVDRVFEVDFLYSGWFLAAELVKTMFLERPFTFETGEDLHLSYQLQKYKEAASYIIPVNANDIATWVDSDHRHAFVPETTNENKNIVQIRNDQWWRAFSRGYVTRWASMNPQKSDVFFYAHSLEEIVDLAPLILRFRSTYAKKAFVVVSGGSYCPCEDAAVMLGWNPSSCHDRRFKIFDLELVSTQHPRSESSQVLPIVMSDIVQSMKGLFKIHSPALIITVTDIAAAVRNSLEIASKHGNVTLVQIPRTSIPYALWMADIKTPTLKKWSKPRISLNIITQSRPRSLKRLLHSLHAAHYLGDEITISFNMDNQVDAETLEIVHNFNWTHGRKTLRRRIVQGGLIRAVSESWYPATDDEFGLLLEDDIEVSPFYYMWLKYALLAYHYDSAAIPELNAISLYTPRLIEVVKERPRFNATDFFKAIHPNTPYLHQLPCSWGALFFPKHWREFYWYMDMRYTLNPKENPVQIPRSRTNGWAASWKKFLIDMMYLRGYVTLYPNFPNQTSFSTNHMEPGAHINSSDNDVDHRKEDFTVPLMTEDFTKLLLQAKLPAAAKLPVLNLFNQAMSLRGLKSAGSKLGQDVIPCNQTQIVIVDHTTGEPIECSTF